jgi:hypothetical protein
MFGPYRRRLCVVAVAVPTLGAAVTAGPGNVSAEQPIAHSRENLSDSFANTSCGIAGTSDVGGVDSFTAFADGTFVENLSTTETFTATATQKSIVIRIANQFSRKSTPIDNGDGTLTFVVTFNGLYEQLRSRTVPCCLLTQAR